MRAFIPAGMPLAISPKTITRYIADIEVVSLFVIGRKLPVLESSIADPVFAAQIGRLHPGLVLLQDRNDLFFGTLFLDQFKGATPRSSEKLLVAWMTGILNIST